MDSKKDVEVVSKFIPPQDALVEYHIKIFNCWEKKRDDRFAPPWSSSILAELPAEAIPLISVTDITPEPLLSTYRFWGSGLTDVFGADFTGRAPAEVPPKSLGVSNEGGCARLASSRMAHYEVKEFVTSRGLFGRALVLRLPFSDDGETVSHGMNSYYFASHTPTAHLSSFFDEVFSRLD